MFSTAAVLGDLSPKGTETPQTNHLSVANPGQAPETPSLSLPRLSPFQTTASGEASRESSPTPDLPLPSVITESASLVKKIKLHTDSKAPLKIDPSTDLRALTIAHFGIEISRLTPLLTELENALLTPVAESEMLTLLQHPLLQMELMAVNEDIAYSLFQSAAETGLDAPLKALLEIERFRETLTRSVKVLLQEKESLLSICLSFLTRRNQTECDFLKTFPEVQNALTSMVQKFTQTLEAGRTQNDESSTHKMKRKHL